MWYMDEPRRALGRKHNRRRDDGRNLILMVDARLNEQRQNMHRTGAAVLLCVVLAGAAWFGLRGARYLGQMLYSGNERYLITHLDVSSDGKLQPSHVREYAHVAEGMNLFAVDPQQVRKDLESVPLVESVEITRHLPDTLVIRVHERVAAARLGDDTATFAMVLDHKGYVLGPTSTSPQLPSIHGFREKGLRPGVRVTDPGVQEALQVIALCDMPRLSHLIKVRSIDVSDNQLLDVRLVRGERVLLSRQDVDSKLEKLCEIMKHTADTGQAIAAIDMTVDRNFPVQYQ
jgi:cell division septal protein FtsQ